MTGRPRSALTQLLESPSPLPAGFVEACAAHADELGAELDKLLRRPELPVRTLIDLVLPEYTRRRLFLIGKLRDPDDVAHFALRVLEMPSTPSDQVPPIDQLTDEQIEEHFDLAGDIQAVFALSASRRPDRYVAAVRHLLAAVREAPAPMRAHLVREVAVRIFELANRDKVKGEHKWEHLRGAILECREPDMLLAVALDVVPDPQLVAHVLKWGSVERLRGNLHTNSSDKPKRGPDRQPVVPAVADDVARLNQLADSTPWDAVVRLLRDLDGQVPVDEVLGTVTDALR